MPVEIELTEDELTKLREFTQCEELSDVVQTAVKEFIRYKQRMKLIELSEQIEMEDNWRELEEAELPHQP